MEYKNLDTWYQGRCHAPGITVEEESEQSDVSQATALAAEEPDLDLANAQLEAIKRRLIELRGKLIKTPEVETMNKIENSVPLTPNQLKLQQLQSCNSALKRQLEKTMQRLQQTRKEMKTLDEQRCQMTTRLSEMAKKLNEFSRCQEKAKHYFGLCIERNEQIKACKLSQQDFSSQMTRVIVHTESRMNHLVPMRCHKQLHYDLSMELVLMRICLHTLFSNMMNDTNQCARRLLQQNWRCNEALPSVDSLKLRD